MPLKENIDFYYNEQGLMVLTAKFHLDRGTCCGNGCKHCPYDYENVPEPKKAGSSPSGTRSKKSPEAEAPSFYDKVFELVRKIPKGRATTYGAIAEAAGIRLSARMVGWAMNGAGHVKPTVPAHRVVNRNGMLSGKHHFATPTLMQELLEAEGITVKNDTIQDFKHIFWDPQGKSPATKRSSAVKPAPPVKKPTTVKKTKKP
ncbi:MGMT family protein [Chitinophaga horti]|uniref:MGMT family protein n=1 Tax=Chitinophaga horti TaxID=2920382 RepID=A0ABY6IYR6_9BACT|nr:MGMT family protein [Chitinophaga horti]UYQ92526.1 MGMT family protein [Chitinophaga horti]